MYQDIGDFYSDACIKIVMIGQKWIWTWFYV